MTDDTPEIMIRMVQELDEVIWERKTTAAEVQRQLGWKKSRLSDLQVFPSRSSWRGCSRVSPSCRRSCVAVRRRRSWWCGARGSGRLRRAAKLRVARKTVLGPTANIKEEAREISYRNDEPGSKEELTKES